MERVISHKRWWYWLVMLAMADPALGHIVIHEVLYDPTSESGGEAVLLYNQDEDRKSVV